MARRGEKLRQTYKYQWYAWLYGIPCYFGEGNLGENFLRGRNAFYDALIPPAAWTHNFFCMLGELLFPEWESSGFPVKIGDELPEELAKELDNDDS